MWDALQNEFAISPSLPWGVLFLRLLGAIILCGIIGFEREVENRPAGLRTHMLVGLASVAYCLLMLDIIDRGDDFSDQTRMDPIRIIEAVTGGVAFLAAGMIVFAQGQVRGLTTGASMWLAASVGLAVGLGLWGIAVMTAVLALIVVRLIKIAEKKAGTYSKSVHEESEGAATPDGQDEAGRSGRQDPQAARTE